jgi:hypothetical protein
LAVGGCRHGRGPYRPDGEDGLGKGRPAGYCHGEVKEVTRRVSFLEGELVAARRARDATEEKLPSLAVNAAAANRRQVA